MIRHLVEPLVVMIIFLAIAGLAAIIISFFAKKYNSEEQNEELLDTLNSLGKKAEHLAINTSNHMAMAELEEQEIMQRKMEKKKKRRIIR